MMCTFGLYELTNVEKAGVEFAKVMLVRVQWAKENMPEQNQLDSSWLGKKVGLRPVSWSLVGLIKIGCSQICLS